MGARRSKKTGGGKGNHRRHTRPERFWPKWCKIAGAQVALPLGYAMRLMRTLSHLARERTGARLAGRRSASIHTKMEQFLKSHAAGLKFRE